MPLNYISCHYWLDLLRKELFILGGNCPDDDRSALLQHAVIATPAAVYAGCNTIIPKPFVLNFNQLTQKVWPSSVSSFLKDEVVCVVWESFHTVLVKAFQPSLIKLCRWSFIIIMKVRQICVCVFGCCYGSSRDDEFDIKLAAETQWQVYLLVQNDFLWSCYQLLWHINIPGPKKPKAHLDVTKYPLWDE